MQQIIVDSSSWTNQYEGTSSFSKHKMLKKAYQKDENKALINRKLPMKNIKMW